MPRTRALIVSLAVGLAAVAGVFALGNTLSLGNQAHVSKDKQVTQRTAQLNRYEASLRKALAQKPPALPPVPAAATVTQSTQSAVSAPVQSVAPVRVVYHRPPPIVVIKHRAGGEPGSEFEGAEQDD
jgi:hypothetical protein